MLWAFRSSATTCPLIEMPCMVFILMRFTSNDHEMDLQIEKE
jgi:hypothetical protein